MSSFKNAAKSNQKTHRERSQLASRSHLGLLEKKKDYKIRAREFQRKKATLKALKRKALDKNPDEFYFKMVKTKMEGGIHKDEDKEVEYTEEQQKIMQSQDIKYVKFKRSIEQKKIDKLRSYLHFNAGLDDKPKNKHIVFVDSKKEAKNFNPDIHLSKKKEDSSLADLDDDTLQNIFKERKKMYKELKKRIERENTLRIIEEKMQMKKNIMDKSVKYTLEKKETKTSAAVYKWKPQRQR